MISAFVELQTGLEVTPRGTVTGIAPGRLWYSNRELQRIPSTLTTALGRDRSIPSYCPVRIEEVPAVIRTFLAPRWCNTRKGATSTFIPRNRGLCNE